MPNLYQKDHLGNRMYEMTCDSSLTGGLIQDVA